MAEVWAALEISGYMDVPESQRADTIIPYPGNSIANGVFVGIDEAAHVEAWRAEIIADDITEKTFHKQLFPVTPEIGPVSVTGTHPDIYRQFMDTVRPQTFPPQKNKIARIVSQVSGLVQFVIDNAADPKIGGTVDTAILERGEGARWLPSRPSFCPENK